MTDLAAAGANAFSGYVGGGLVTDPAQLQAMSAEQMAEYVRRQGDPRNAPWPSSQIAFGMMSNTVRWPLPARPTMTLAEFDARLAAFKARSDRP